MSLAELFAAELLHEAVERGKAVGRLLEHARVLEARLELRADLLLHDLQRLGFAELRAGVFVREPVDPRGVLGRGLRSVGALWGLFRAVFMARAIVKDFRPDAVIGFGAYASFPSLVAAKLSGVPIAVHEQNAMPGLTNRMLAKLAKRVFLSLPDVTGAFDAKKSQLTGNPVREAIVESGKNAVGHPGTRRLLVMGGSQGAKAVNSVILASLERVLAGYRAHGVDASGVTPFIEDVAAAYQWADLVLCRAGATSVAELAVAGKPAVLVPFPYATHDHQTYNAQVMVDQGAALLVAEKDLPHLDAGGMLINLLLDPGTLRTMSQMAHTCARPDAASKVAQGVLALCRQS